MSAFDFNVALGRAAEFHWRVENSDPTNAGIQVMVLASAGLESDAALKDYDTFAAILAGTTNEPTNTNYARQTLTETQLAAWAVDDNTDSILLPMPTITFTSIAAGDSWDKIVFGYDSDTTTGNDTNIIPISAHDLRISGMAVIPNGSNIVVAFPNGYIVCD